MDTNPMSVSDLMTKFIPSFVNGRAIVREGKKWYHIFPTGEPAYDKRFTMVWHFVRVEKPDGTVIYLAVVREVKKYFHILYDGTPAYNQRYDEVDDFKNGKAAVVLKGDSFFIGTDGSRIE